MRSFSQTRNKLTEEATDRALPLIEATRDHLSKFDDREKAAYPSDRKIPNVLILKRKAIRVYPDHQKVALYYAQNIDKYVTIPFGLEDTGVATVKEATSVPSVQGANTGKPMPWSAQSLASTRPDYHDLHNEYMSHLSKTVRAPDDHDVDSAAMAAIHADRANRVLHKIQKHYPGEKAVASYTAGRQHVSNLEAQKQKEHANSAKQLLHPNNFSGDVVRDAGYLTGTAVRLVGRGIAAMARKSIRESFQEKLEEQEAEAPTVPASEAQKRIEQNKARRDGQRKKVVSTRKEIERLADEGDVEGAEKHAKENPAIIPNKEVNNALDQASGERTEKSISNLETVAPYVVGGIAAGVALKGAGAAARGIKGIAGRVRAPGSTITKPGGVPKPTPKPGIRPGTVAKVGAGAAAAGAVGNSILNRPSTGVGSPNNGPPTPKAYDFNLKAKSTTPTRSVDYAIRGGGDSSRFQKAITGPVRESNFDIIKKMVENKDLTETIKFNDQKSLNINSNIARKLVRLHGSLNEANRTKMKTMLNESEDSFRVVVNFTKRI